MGQGQSRFALEWDEKTAKGVANITSCLNATSCAPSPGSSYLSAPYIPVDIRFVTDQWNSGRLLRSVVLTWDNPHDLEKLQNLSPEMRAEIQGLEIGFPPRLKTWPEMTRPCLFPNLKSLCLFTCSGTDYSIATAYDLVSACLDMPSLCQVSWESSFQASMMLTDVSQPALTQFPELSLSSSNMHIAQAFDREFSNDPLDDLCKKEKSALVLFLRNERNLSETDLFSLATSCNKLFHRGTQYFHHLLFCYVCHQAHRLKIEEIMFPLS